MTLFTYTCKHAAGPRLKLESRKKVNEAQSNVWQTKPSSAYNAAWQCISTLNLRTNSCEKRVFKQYIRMMEHDFLKKCIGRRKSRKPRLNSQT